MPSVSTRDGLRTRRSIRARYRAAHGIAERQLTRFPTARKWRIGVLGGLLVAVALLLRFMVFPTSDPAEPTDAVVVLAGAPEWRLPVAMRLAERGPRVLVISAADGEVNAPAHALCGHPPLDVKVYCFRPSGTQNTRDEARSLQRLVLDHGWKTITVVTSTYHMLRAGLLVRRCTDARVNMVEARPVMSAPQWTYHVVHEVGGLADAMVSRSC